jgi:hypothetical protein
LGSAPIDFPPRLFALDLTDDTIRELTIGADDRGFSTPGGRAPLGFGEDDSGELYVLTTAGEVIKLVSVPEPGTLALGGVAAVTGLAGLLRGRRRRECDGRHAVPAGAASDLGACRPFAGQEFGPSGISVGHHVEYAAHVTWAVVAQKAPRIPRLAPRASWGQGHAPVHGAPGAKPGDGAPTEHPDEPKVLSVALAVSGAAATTRVPAERATDRRSPRGCSGPSGLGVLRPGVRLFQHHVAKLDRVAVAREAEEAAGAILAGVRLVGQELGDRR